MNKTISLVTLTAVIAGACLAGCGDSGPSASPDRMVESRDKQFKAMAQQRGAGGQQSAEKASQAQGK